MTDAHRRSAASTRTTAAKSRRQGAANRGPLSAMRFVQASLAEAEYDATTIKRRDAAADAPCAPDPGWSRPLIYRGRALARTSQGRKDADWKLRKAREACLAANKIDTEDPEPLLLYFESFLEEGNEPTKNAIDALHYASVLAPQDDGVRFDSATAFSCQRWTIG